MYRQAKIVSTWGKNVYVKIPIINTRKVSMAPLIVKLVAESIPVNVTAVLSRAQMSAAKEAILFGMNHGGGAVNGMPHIISVFAGRLADIGCLELCALTKSDRACVWQGIQWLWASPREIYNIFNAEEFGYNIITIGHDLLKKIPLIGKDPDKYSLETVRMFYNDAKACGFKL
jgi:transaldolase